MGPRLPFRLGGPAAIRFATALGPPVALWLLAAGGQAQPSLARDPGAGADDPLFKIVDDALAGLAARREAQARVHLANRNYPAALRELTTVNDIQPHNPLVTEELADLHQIVGDDQRAERFYRETIELVPDRGEPYLKLVALLTRVRGQRPEVRLKEANTLLGRARGILGDTPQVALHAARLYAGQGLFDKARAAYERVVVKTDDAAILLEVGDFLRDSGRHDLALEQYRRVQRPPAQVRDAAQRIFELEVLDEARRLGLDARRQRVPKAVESQLSMARQLAGSGNPRRASSVLAQALAQAPVFAEAHAELARVRARLGKADAAEVSYLRALSIEGGRAEWLAELSELYEKQSPARRAEAGLLLGRALKLRPDWAELHLRLARVERMRGDLPRALAHVKRFLTQRSEGPEHEEAEHLRDELEKTLGPVAGTPPLEPDPLAADPARRALQRARAHLGRGETDAALTVLRSLSGTARSHDVRLLEARVLNASGRHADAALVLERLVRRHRTPELLRELAGTQMRAGRPARARIRWLEAEQGGDAAASFELARMDAARAAGAWAPLADALRLVSLWDAYRRLNAPLIAGSADVSQRASVLSRNVRTRIVIAVSAVAFAFLFVTLLPIWWVRRRDGGSDLYELVARYPEAGPDVQRIMAAIRHEVLKHNTMMLAGLSRALADGQPAGDHGRHLREAIFGSGGGPGASDRLETYLRELRRLGRGHGLRMNLERRDPVTRVLLAGMRALGRLGTRLDRLDRLRPGARRRVLERLKEADELLNDRGYSELRALLDHIRVFSVTEAALLAIFERVGREPAIATLTIEPLTIEGRDQLPCTVDVPQAAFEDIIANLIRNAIQSEARQHEGAQDAASRPIAVGLLVAVERDSVTALSRVSFSVRDRARRSLTQEELHGQYVEQGLGLTADLVARYHGSLDVRPEGAGGGPGWVKAVVLTVPHVDGDVG